MVIAGQRDPHVHAEETGDDIDRQRQHGDHRQRIERAVILLHQLGAQLLLQQPDAFGQAGEIVQYHGELFGKLPQILYHLAAQPGRRPVQQAKQRGRLRRQQALKAQ